MANNDAARARRRAQRENVKARAEGRLRLENVTHRARQARRDYADRVIAGTEPMPEMGSKESKNLASLASKASRGKADPRYEKAFAKFWYHKNDQKDESQPTSVDEDIMHPERYESDDEDSEV
jgi:hypothetical protein